MKDTYRNLCEERNDIPLFQQAWWLDAAASDDWDVVLVEKGGKIEAALPFVLKKYYGISLVSQPALTQYLGPWLAPASGKRAKQLAREKDLMQLLIDRLPPHHIYRQSWSPQLQNWMPFYWRGFSQTTRYSYRLEDLSDLDLIWGGFQASIRGDIRKAQKMGVQVRQSDNIEAFLKLNAMVFQRQKRSIPYKREYVLGIDQVAAERNQRAIFIAADESGREHAAVYLVWDEHSAYYLMGGGNPQLRNSGATSLCMWEAIKFAANVTKIFDFEGSMLEPVERFFRGFGGEPVPFFSVTRTSNRLLRMALNFR